MIEKEFLLQDIKTIAKEVYSHILLKAHAEHATIVAFHGELGAGKTTLIKELAHLLGISEHDIASPTFGIMHFHDIQEEHSVLFRKLVHIDAYRLENPDEIEILDWENIKNTQSNLVCVEWPEKIENKMFPDTIHIHLTHVDEVKRKISY